ncbi:MAG: lysyl oxidase family protein [Acidimicrobiales bacterium]
MAVAERRRSSTGRTGVILGCVLLCVASTVLLAGSTAGAAGAGPDLGMARLGDIRITRTQSGQVLLRYSATVVNVGSDPFELRGERAATTGDMQVFQRVYDGAGGYGDVAAPTSMVFGGDGHNHWHVRDLTDTELIRLDNGSKVGTGAKRGFCFFDNTQYRLGLPGAPQAPVYPGAGCGTSTSLTVTMGLSVGWGDIYSSSLPDQYVDITGLTAGRYRLKVTADTAGRFVEANTSNNTTWVDLQIKGQGAPKILAWGPSA